ncbi:unnamed protein product, partial [Rotaria sp. Silwood1]
DALATRLYSVRMME